MAGINECRFWGMVTRPELREPRPGMVIQSYTLLVKSAGYDREKKQDAVIETWISCERFLPDDYAPADQVFQGDYVLVEAEYTQQRGNDGKDHSRFVILAQTVTRRGRAFRDSTGGMPAQPAARPEAAPAPQVDDPWAVGR